MDSKVAMETVLKFPFLQGEWGNSKVSLANHPGTNSCKPVFPIRNTLGAGGLGAVFDVQQGALKTMSLSALKSIPSVTGFTKTQFETELSVRRQTFFTWLGSVEGQTLSTRLEREADVLRSIQHPHVVRVQHAIGKVILSSNSSVNLKLPYFIMDRLCGENLQQRIDTVHTAGVPEDFNEIILIAYRVAWGLATLNDMNVVHRDIKPSNIYLRSPIDPVILDLGLVKRSWDTPISYVKDNAGNLVQDVDNQPIPRPVPGTRYYAPWEQVNGTAGSFPIDQFALGVILYKYCTGQFPYLTTASSAPNSGHTIVPPHRLNRAVPVDLSKIICKMLAKSPQDRYQNMRDVMAELEWSIADTRHLVSLSSTSQGLLDLVTFPSTDSILSARDFLKNLISVIATSRQELLQSAEIRSPEDSSPASVKSFVHSSIESISYQLHDYPTELKAIVSHLEGHLKNAGDAARRLKKRADFLESTDVLDVLHKTLAQLMSFLGELDLGLARRLTMH